MSTGICIELWIGGAQRFLGIAYGSECGALVLVIRARIVHLVAQSVCCLQPPAPLHARGGSEPSTSIFGRSNSLSSFCWPLRYLA